jgi:hypothetical protein
MGFLAALRRLLGDQPATADDANRRPARAEALGEAPEGHEPTAEGGTSPYDRALWIKKLQHILSEKLPIDDQTWHDFLADAYALGFDRPWVEAQERSAFEKLVRKAVSDGVLTAEERHRIDMARAQIGLSANEAVDLLNRVVAESKAAGSRPAQRA